MFRFAIQLALYFFVVFCSSALAELPSGVASGDVSQESVYLWTRSDAPGELTFEVSTSSDFANPVSTTATIGADALVPVKVQVGGLDPATQYYYRATDATSSTATGSFRTAAAPGTNSSLRFGVTGDWRGEVSPYLAIANMPERNLDFLVAHGDTIYADIESPALPGVAQAVTIEQFRAKHAEVYGERFGLNKWAEVRASTPIFATIDDHEVTNDFSGGADVATDERFADAAGTRINDSVMFENGLQAFQEYNPIADRFFPEAEDPRTSGERQLYRSQRFGDTAQLIVLDNRSFRDAAIADPDATNPADFVRFATEANDPSRTMLGAAQLADLKSDLMSAQQNDVTWKFIAIPEPIQSLGPLVGPSDRFDGYLAERNDIMHFIDSNNIENVVFVSADIHGSIVNEILYTNPTTGERTVSSAWGISTGSVGFADPFGQTVVAVAAAGEQLTAEQLALYDQLPILNEDEIIPGTGLANKDDFLEVAFNDLALTPFAELPGIAPVSLIGLDEGTVDAEVLFGDYMATHHFGWTEFEVDEAGVLTISNYGIEPYDAEDLADETIRAEILNRMPQLVGQFRVQPVPEPNSATLCMLALASLLMLRRKQR